MLLLFSAICCDIFESPYETSSSANVESDFKNVKLSLSDIIPCRVDVLVERHLEMIDGAVKIASQKYLNYVEEVSAESDENLGDAFDEVTLEKTPDAPDIVMDDHSRTTNTELTCMACENNHTPSDAHTCYLCGKSVHLLSGCSLSIGEEEGFGEKRICMICSKQPTHSTNSIRPTKQTKPSTHPSRKSTRTKKHSEKSPVKKVLYTELNHKETWNKRQKTKRSNYIRPSPHWDLSGN